MSILKPLSLNHIPPQLGNKNELDILRERILHVLLLISTILTFGFFIGSIFFQTDLQQKPSTAVIGVVSGFLFLLFIGRRFAYNFRGYSFLMILYGACFWTVLVSGLQGVGTLILLAFTILAGILFGMRAILGALTISIATLVLFGFGISSGSIPSPEKNPFVDATQPNNWVVTGAIFALMASVVSISISIVVNSLQSSLTRQLHLSHELEREHSSLSESIKLNNEKLDLRLKQIQTLSDISNTIRSMQDQKAILQVVVDLIQERFQLYYVGAFLVDNTGTYAILRAGSGDAGRVMLDKGHRLLIGGTSMIGWAISNRASRIAADVNAEIVRFSNPDLPLTRSELALPIIGREQVLGALTIQSVQPNRFDDEDIKILSGIADILGIALENTQLAMQALQDKEEIRTLNRQYIQQAWGYALDTTGRLEFQYDEAASPTNSDHSPTQIPIQLREETIGAISLDLGEKDLTPDDKRFIDAITTQVALALENARLLQETQRRAQQEEKINQLTSQFSRGLNIEEILKSALREFSKLPSVTEVSVHLNPTGTDRGGNQMAEGTNAEGRSY